MRSKMCSRRAGLKFFETQRKLPEGNQLRFSKIR